MPFKFLITWPRKAWVRSVAGARSRRGARVMSGWRGRRGRGSRRRGWGQGRRHTTQLGERVAAVRSVGAQAGGMPCGSEGRGASVQVPRLAGSVVGGTPFVACGSEGRGAPCKCRVAARGVGEVSRRGHGTVQVTAPFKAVVGGTTPFKCREVSRKGHNCLLDHGELGSITAP